MRQYLLHSNDRSTATDALDARMQRFARRKRGGSAAKSLLSALRAMEKLGMLGAIVKNFYSFQAKAIEKLQNNRVHRVDATSGTLEFLGKSRKFRS